ncbi:lysine--tRNA ligase [Candidatus Legionella polyplacis]|uniref:Lysine--tRNA ligase n=1 Tax=Candidatus Legionella polyplacis TaxID=2005262 RepID=A0ABZ2GYL6_9GAMM
MINKNYLNNTSFVYRVRKEKLINLRKQGFNYPNNINYKDLISVILSKYKYKEKDFLFKNKINVIVAGRVILRRIIGRAGFFHVQDISGKLQVYINKKDFLELFNKLKDLDLGDIVWISGVLFKTNTGEITVRANEMELLAKSLHPMPDKFHGLSDKEICYRKRYIDLISNDRTRRTFLLRSKIIRNLRIFMDNNNFIEVETPMLQSIPGGGEARPFVTYHNVLDKKIFLRVAPEIYLKKLIVGGFERVYEINRNFRNEGLSICHNPEFTMIEFYHVYSDYHYLMDFTEKLIHYLCDSVLGTREVVYQNQLIDFRKPFSRLTIKESIVAYNKDIEEKDIDTLDKCRKFLDSVHVIYNEMDSLDRLHMIMFEKTVEKFLIQPTFITDYPVEFSPLARRCDCNRNISERFELFICGYEIANGFSELNDPEDQEIRFREQIVKKNIDDEEKMMYFDLDYIEALEYGMPPVAGEGIGIDRLVMILTNSVSIRDVILFPLMR